MMVGSALCPSPLDPPLPLQLPAPLALEDLRAWSLLLPNSRVTPQRAPTWPVVQGLLCLWLTHWHLGKNRIILVFPEHCSTQRGPPGGTTLGLLGVEVQGQEGFPGLQRGTAERLEFEESVHRHPVLWKAQGGEPGGGGSQSQRTRDHSDIQANKGCQHHAARPNICTARRKQPLAQGRPSVNSCGEERNCGFQLSFPLGFPERLVPCLQNGVVTSVLPILSDCHGEQMEG